MTKDKLYDQSCEKYSLSEENQNLKKLLRNAEKQLEVWIKKRISNFLKLRNVKYKIIYWIRLKFYAKLNNVSSSRKVKIYSL